MNKREVLELIKMIMPNPGSIFDTPEEVVEAIWRNISQVEIDMNFEDEKGKQ